MNALRTTPWPDVVLPETGVLLVVPPFVYFDTASLAAHLLQARAGAGGIEVGVFYANLHLATVLGADTYRSLCFDLQHIPLVGERFFARQAFGVDAPIGGADGQAHQRRAPAAVSQILDDQAVEDLRDSVRDWPELVGSAIAHHGYSVVGCTCSFEQITASAAILRTVKGRSSDTVTVLGGANCEGEMADGLAALGTGIDHFFSGESDDTFLPFLRTVLEEERAPPRIIRGAMRRELDDLPLPDFSEYFAQISSLLPEVDPAAKSWVPYETSRGCWWGEKHHCTFCGLNGEGIQFRRKSPEVVLGDLERVSSSYPTRKLQMVDNIMPRPYLQSLLPELADRDLNLEIFYQQKANLSIEDVQVLRSAGVRLIQPGIEALSTPLLRLMKKGVRAEQNIALLRHARSSGLGITWSILFGFPGDRVEWYEDTLRLLALMRHLHPPKGVFRLSLDRFSPYYTDPDRYGISGMRPLSAYRDILPDGADIDRMAYYFEADYDSGSLAAPELVAQIRGEVARWRSAWFQRADDDLPELVVGRMTAKAWLLRDTRGIPGTEESTILDRAEAAVAVHGTSDRGSAEADAALECRAAAEIDGRIAPLATGAPEVLADLRP